jgi:ribonuclease HII
MIICGIDEVGKGSLAGNFVCCAAAFEISSIDDITNNPIEGVKDSKKFNSHKARETVEARILAFPTFRSYGIGIVSVNEINKFGMGWALQEGFTRAILNCIVVYSKESKMQFLPDPDFILVDGTIPITACKFPQKVLPKADSLWWPVSAASILAKTFRDREMIALSKDYPDFGFDSNSGYGSSGHINAIIKHGSVSGVHREQFVKTALATRAKNASIKSKSV